MWIICVLYLKNILRYSVDPKTLCPFCDQQLPTILDAVLLDRLKGFRVEALPEPRIGNPLGLKTSMNIFQLVCIPHSSGVNTILTAKARGWPLKIDFLALPTRVRRLQPVLAKIVAVPSLSPVYKATLSMGKNTHNRGISAEDWAFHHAHTG